MQVRTRVQGVRREYNRETDVRTFDLPATKNTPFSAETFQRGHFQQETKTKATTATKINDRI